MNKTNFLDFIDKYTIGGEVQRIAISSEGGSLSTEFCTEDKTLIGMMEYENIGVPDCEFGIFNTKNLVKVLKIFQNQVDFEIVRNAEAIPYKLKISDEVLKGMFILASADVIPEIPSFKGEPNWDFEMDLTPSFIRNFKKGISALGDSANDFVSVAFNNNGGDLEVIINHSSDDDTDQVIIPANVEDIDFLEPLRFNGTRMESIFSANSNYSNGKISVSQQGLMKVEFSSKTYNVKYYLIMLSNS